MFPLSQDNSLLASHTAESLSHLLNGVPLDGAGGPSAFRSLNKNSVPTPTALRLPNQDELAPLQFAPRCSMITSSIAPPAPTHQYFNIPPSSFSVTTQPAVTNSTPFPAALGTIGSSLKQADTMNIPTNSTDLLSILKEQLTSGRTPSPALHLFSNQYQFAAPQYAPISENKMTGTSMSTSAFQPILSAPISSGTTMSVDMNRTTGSSGPFPDLTDVINMFGQYRQCVNPAASTHWPYGTTALNLLAQTPPQPLAFSPPITGTSLGSSSSDCVLTSSNDRYNLLSDDEEVAPSSPAIRGKYTIYSDEDDETPEGDATQLPKNLCYFSSREREMLITEYNLNKLPSRETVQMIAREMGTSMERVRAWFSRRRQWEKAAREKQERPVARAPITHSRRLKPETRAKLKALFQKKDYPTDGQFKLIATEEGTTVKQLRKWFTRRRYQKKKKTMVNCADQ